ncbi:hypothetical protein JR334_06620 [Clostridia bacterium]|nr:hypothetical protein JR334_06620 [Clostridia bacterium]
MESYIEKILNGSIYDHEILRLFYLHPVDVIPQGKYAEGELQRVAAHILKTINKTSVRKIIDIIEADATSIQDISAKNIPQYSSINSIDDVIRIVESNPGCNYQLIGYFFNKTGSKGAQTKYGENHYKTASLMHLTTKHQPFSVSYIGKEYIEFDDDVRKEIRTKLFLLIPIIQKSVIDARYHEVNMMGILRNYLSESTAIRRRPNVRTMLEYVCKSIDSEEIIETHLKWK